MKQAKNLKTVKVHKKSSLPYSEICDGGEDTSAYDESFFDGDVEILMGEDIDLKNAKVEKVFVF
ncbi:hypothetical protein RBU49_04255 [Clostridium sp. MB40-C1]|uniref:hypothetical protein n=1 Tax=Clostridium sp. MB40-C1 TaxID=3070996 RepID=UPI0027DFF517|nr:hypothetical protein [Clostridium sp. MB40-C1]WMJ81473.1 hypothetical protein RBU49_04255 [Clostridium sp. MB40-C1]